MPPNNLFRFTVDRSQADATLLSIRADTPSMTYAIYNRGNNSSHMSELSMENAKLKLQIEMIQNILRASWEDIGHPNYERPYRPHPYQRDLLKPERRNRKPISNWWEQEEAALKNQAKTEDDDEWGKR